MNICLAIKLLTSFHFNATSCVEILCLNVCNIFINFLLVYCFVVCGLGFYNVSAMMLPGYLNSRCFTSCYQYIYHPGGGYMDAWMNFSILQLVS